MYTIRIRLGDELETIPFSSRGKMISAASEYAENGYIVSYLGDWS